MSESSDVPEAPTAQPCARCGAPLVCAGAQGLDECWCAAYPHVLPMPKQGASCLCRACLELEIARRMNSPRQ